MRSARRMTSSGRNSSTASSGLDLAADRRLQPHAGAAEGLEDLGVAGLAGQRVEVDDGPVEVGVDVDRR